MLSVIQLWNVYLSSTNDVFCKLIFYVAYVSLSLALRFTALAGIDRFLSTSPNVQFGQLSIMLVARKITAFIITYR
jgi:hypothetical protein